MTKDEIIHMLYFNIISGKDNIAIYNQNLKFLKVVCIIYHSLERDNVIKKAIDTVLSIHEMKRISGEAARHREAFVLRYISTAPLSYKQIAERLNISLRQAYKDINNMHIDLMPLLFGIDGIKFIQ